MKTVDKLTDQDVISQLPTVDHATKATTLSKIQSNDHTQVNHYHSNDAPKLNDVHGGTHRDFSNIPIAERQALQDLYESTDGAHWNYGSFSSAGTHWSFDGPDVNPCVEGWYGVHCVDNRITGLSLAGSNMIGTIPESLSQLTMLMHLDLGGNLLIGRVPTTLCQIKSLVRVDLERNSITCYPHCLEHAAVEVKVHPSTPVCNNTPPSPSSQSGPSKYASSSSSTLVKTSSHDNISPLERQALQDLYDSTDGQNWSYPSVYGTDGNPWDFSNPDANPCVEGWYGIKCSDDYHVTSLYLDYSNLRGTIPSSIGQFSSLLYLSLRRNQLIGTIPSTIGHLSSLQYLWLQGNQLIGTIPQSIYQLSSLQHLGLPENRLTGTIAASIGQLSSSIQLIDLRINQLIGTIPSTIGQLSSLWYVSLDSNQLTGVVPASLCQQSLFYFQFHNSPLQCYPQCLLSRAQYLNAGLTPICASEQPTVVPTVVPSTRSPSTAAPTVKPSTRSPSTAAPTVVPTRSPSTVAPTVVSTRSPSTRAPSVVPTRSPSTAKPTVVPTCRPSTRAPSVKPSTRSPSTTAPTEVPSTLSPSIKNNISPLERLAMQDLYDSTGGPNWYNYNGLPGIPWDFSNPNVNPCNEDERWYGVTCSAEYYVIELSLWGHNLRGTIPSTIGQLSSLQRLILDDNLLIGTIPSTIGQLSSLQDLYLHSNLLTGIVPVELCQLNIIYRLYCSGNLLQCYPACLQEVLNLYAGSTPRCDQPTVAPTVVPTSSPSTAAPTVVPTSSPSTRAPSVKPSTRSPSTAAPTVVPSTRRPSTAAPTVVPSTRRPSTAAPTVKPSTRTPSTRSPSIKNNISPLERQALQDLYDSTGGPDWSYNYDGIPWDFSNPNANPCIENERWYGVTCVDFHVTVLALYENNLIGSIPSTIGQLSYLQALYLHDNQLTGIVPVELCQLNIIYGLYFSGNLLQCYPACLQEVPNLYAGSTPTCT